MDPGVDRWVLGTTLLLGESGVFQPLEGLSWWSTVSLGLNKPAVFKSLQKCIFKITQVTVVVSWAVVGAGAFAFNS